MFSSQKSKIHSWRDYYARGIEFLIQDKFDEALDDFENYSINQENHCQILSSDDAFLLQSLVLFAYRSKGADCLDKEQFEVAVRVYSMALGYCKDSEIPLLKQNNNLAELYYNRGMACFRMQQFDFAIKDFNLALTHLNYRNDGNERIEIAITNLADQLQAALTRVHPKFQVYFSSALLFFILKHRGEAHFNQKNFQQAISDLNDAFTLIEKRAPQEMIPIKRLCAQAHIHLGDHLAAVKEYQAILEALSENLTKDQLKMYQAYVDKLTGGHYLSNDKYDQAVRCYKKAYKNFDKNHIADLLTPYACSIATLIEKTNSKEKYNEFSAQEILIVIKEYLSMLEPDRLSKAIRKIDAFSGSALLKNLPQNQPLKRNAILELAGDQSYRKYVGDIEVSFLQDAIRYYKEAYECQDDFQICKIELSDKLVRAHMSMMMHIMNTLSNSDYFSDQKVRKRSQFLRHYQKIQSLSCGYQDTEFADQCFEYGVMICFQKKTTKKEMLFALEFCNMALSFDANNIDCRALRAFVYHKLVALHSDDPKEMIRFFSHAFSDWVSILKQAPAFFIFLENPNRPKCFSGRAVHEERLLKKIVSDMKKTLSSLSAADLIAIVSQFFIGTQRIVLSQCLDENHIFGAFIKDRGVVEKYQIKNEIETYLKENKPLKLSARFFKSAAEFQEYENEAKKERADAKKSEDRIGLFSNKIDVEYEKHENKALENDHHDDIYQL